MPSTNMGKWAGWLLVLALACFALFFGFVMAGQRGGDTFFSNLTLTIPILISALAAIAGGIVGVVARRNDDRSIVVRLAIFVGAVVVMWIAAEIAFPH
jgi:drug/metabolite transporter (DMT)-like permease